MAFDTRRERIFGLVGTSYVYRAVSPGANSANFGKLQIFKMCEVPTMKFKGFNSISISHRIFFLNSGKILENVQNSCNIQIFFANFCNFRTNFDQFPKIAGLFGIKCDEF